MKLCRYGTRGAEKPGLIDADGRIRDLSGVIADVTPAEVTPEALARLAEIGPATLPLVEGTPRYGVPVAGIGKFIAIGLNYADHAKEAGLEPPPEPIFFTKAISCLTGPNDPVMIPRDSQKTDWEVELGIVIGKTCRYVEQADALDHVAGYVLANDVSERAFQKELGSQWDKGKGCDTFGPVGPWLVTADEVGDCQTLDMFLDVNGKRMQTGNTATMIFPVAECIAYVSRFITLHPGDLLITGTPPGVGEGQKPDKIFLKAGDTMHLGITGLGEQRQTCVPFAMELPA
ncbi:fumarylacetoacetate hydrolase family protein [Sphingomonas aquatilis]|uniref:2-keto-4-pentenoate hydratase/2-oxohepta-3-ene-1,7-dioic acid hydratase in catechol pathway n=1 Tax=Sphingomonas aquatilis TaxID=93063 RepID=A0AAW3TSW1_9SPHN|nr:fumarylacetoacetate hydrolase family protein [Sphingomonas aquatilis]MBB3874559.1 2-keto-4-pentenoate hydratase/2-oxohepta-3-ene-1,7-dioic acid hydratase in catechol pathway [Sphingomonas aquatilis]MCI4653939.1 fumarylacetoacetate hydrolase family protein [Sphingomonas aquatilis]GEM72064.1 ureidoglycolate lyase [Sphingomonas aquatilis NBRC 16722]